MSLGSHVLTLCVGEMRGSGCLSLQPGEASGYCDFPAQQAWGHTEAWPFSWVAMGPPL